MLRSSHKLNWVFLIITLGVLAGCSREGGDDEPAYLERSVNLIYNRALDLLKDKEYKSAASEFDEVERQHPYSTWATKAQLMSAYSYYAGNNYAEALSGFDRFIQLHPAHKDIPYAYYLKALSYYEQISDVARDQEMTERALKSLREIVARFPKTKYARDAKLKIDLTVNHLAGKEMTIGRYYQNKKQYLAAINRFKIVARDYQQTSQAPESLLRLVESYLSLGLQHEAQKVGAVLGHNYPGSEWYSDAYVLLDGKIAVKETKSPRAGTDIAVSSEPWYKFW